jgi:diguanylate cyclase (GGDEF)-like protein
MSRLKQSVVRARNIQPEFAIASVIAAGLAAGLVAIAVYLPGAMKAAALESAYRGNIDAADQIKITRGYYTRSVVSKALKSGALMPSYNHANDPNEIPLPATFVQDISELLKQKDTTLSLVSPYPWPHRAGRQMDNFQSNAWEHFQTDPSAVFSREEMRDGRRILRVAVADKMTGQTCVACHNSDPESPKKDWKLGDVRAVMEVTKVVEPYFAAAEQKSGMIILALASATLVVCGLLFAGAGVFARYNRSKREADMNVRYLAHHDAMTGSLNRTRFLELLCSRLAESRDDHQIAVHYIDLDGFKDINDRYGHAIGDELISTVANRLKDSLSEDDLIARLGGDEFAVAQIGIKNLADAEQRASHIVDILSQPFQLARNRLLISASVGTCSTSEVRDTADKILEYADTALYQAKLSGRNQCVMFSPAMQKELLERRALERLVHRAVAAEMLELHFQPLYDTRLKLAGFEALLRLSDGKGGLISPAKFIPIAEAIGAIPQIGEWVIRRACQVATCWPSHLIVAVNLSPAQFHDADSVAGAVRRALQHSGLEAHRLELEITEGLFLEDRKEILEELHCLKQMGCSIVMDDFGVGHSNMSYLWKFPFDKLKIDRSFIAAPAEASTTIAPILQTIVNLGRALNMRITAEGIETDEQAKLFVALDCDFMQGYLFGRPMVETEIASVIHRDFISRSNMTDRATQLLNVEKAVAS